MKYIIYAYFTLSCLLGVFSPSTMTALAQPTVILAENFDGCSLPAGWQNNADTGVNVWSLGQDTNNWTQNMDGTCMAFFNDDALGDAAPYSRVTLLSPPFDGTQNAIITFEIDFHLRQYNASALSFMVFDGTEYRPLASYSGQNYTGDAYSDEAHAVIDISAYRATNNRIAIVYDDGSTWAWWAAVDNFKITGEGTMSDDCSRAQALSLNVPCTSMYSNVNAIFTGANPNCVASTESGIWFSFQAPAGGAANVVTNADFNEVVTVFSGTCSGLTQIACTNFDEFGFMTETLRLTGLTSGQTYFVRVSGVTDSFGASEGNVCVEIQTAGAPATPPPSNDNCTNAVVLGIGQACVNGTNRAATMQPTEPVPSRNARSRASVWYRFTAPANGSVLIENDADFADVLTVYGGSNCSNLTEVGGNDYGRTLALTGLTAGQTYYIQISGYFATVEGNFCVRITNPPPAPANEICTQAVSLVVDDSDCTMGNNQNAHFNGALVDLMAPFESYSSSNETGVTYTRPSQGATCEMSTTTPQYDVFSFVVDVTGSYTILNAYSENYDGYLHIYANSFDPNNPCATYLAGNDDYNGIAYSTVTVTLTASTPYYIVTSAWESYQSGTYTTTIEGPGEASTLLNDANINGMFTTCDFQADAPLWYEFVAPASGRVRIATGADFVHTVSLYSGVCGNMTQVGCAYNPSRCEDAPLFTGLEPGDTYFVQIASARTAFGYNYGDVCVQVKESAADPIRVKVKAFLEGAYSGNGAMSTALSQYHLISEEQPYNAAPWYYEGEECAETTAANAVDWVLVELRSATDNNVIVAQKAAMLTNTGAINDRGKDGMYFDVPAGDYYIVVRHRNHMAVMSAVPVPLPNINVYSFAAGMNYALGSSQLKDMGDGNFALHAGDVDGNGVIVVSDFNIYATQIAQINVYTGSDINLDRAVTAADFNKYQPNASRIGIAQIRY